MGTANEKEASQYPKVEFSMNKHIFVAGAIGAGKSTAMSVLFEPNKTATH